MEGSKTYIKIPGDRIGALVGPEGTVKNVIERKLSVDLEVDSENGTVQITLPANSRGPNGSLQSQRGGNCNRQRLRARARFQAARR